MTHEKSPEDGLPNTSSHVTPPSLRQQLDDAWEEIHYRPTEEKINAYYALKEAQIIRDMLTVDDGFGHSWLRAAKAWRTDRLDRLRKGKP